MKKSTTIAIDLANKTTRTAWALRKYHAPLTYE